MKGYQKTLLVLGLSLAMQQGTAWADQTVTGDISGGDYVRTSDGVNGETFTIQSKAGGDLNISGGTFKTANPQIYTQGVVTVRDDNIRLYNSASKDPVTGLYSLHTPESVEEAYKTGNTAQFAPANNPTAIPTKEEVLKALEAANSLKESAGVTAWQIKADGNMNVTGGNFDLTTTNAASIKAGGSLLWRNASLKTAGGGGALTIDAAKGMTIESGSIRSEGASDSGPYAQKYDDRGRLDRDRWTLGNYLYLKTDGDITLGTKGSATGPEIYVGDGMLFFTGSTQGAATGNLYINSGSLTLDGQYRSTLNTGSMAHTYIDGGALNVITADRINRNGVDSASMYLGDLTLNSGSINLYNGQLGGSVTINGGVVNAVGDSAINSGAKDVVINGGTINLGERAFIGAIQGDSLEISPYPTSTANVTIGDNAVVNLTLAKSSDGQVVVGRNVGGIYTINGSNATSITISDKAQFNVADPYAFGVGTVTVNDFAKAENGTVTVGGSGMASSASNPYYSAQVSGNGGNSASLTLTTNHPSSVIGRMGFNENLTDNAGAFSDLLINGQGVWRDFAAAVVAQGNNLGAGGELLRQAGGESVTGNAYAILSTVREMQDTVRDRGFGNIAPVRNGTSQELGHGNRLWINAVGQTANQSDRSGVTGYSNQSAGLVAGFDHTFADRYLAGIAVGYTRGFFESNDDLTKGYSNNWFFSLYGSFNFNPLVVDADVFYANTQTSLDNTIAGFSSNSGDIASDTLGASLTASWVFDFNNGATKLAPYVGIEYLGIHQHGWDDSGRLQRSFDDDFSTLWTLPVGVRASHTFEGEGWKVTPSVGLAYARDLNKFRPEASVTMPGMNSRIVSRGPDLAQDSFRGDIGLNFEAQDFSFYLQYNLDARSHYTNHSGTLGVAYHF
ncbi:autotransporter domain-containing protein [Desulfovibrio piger]|nr:autotransporter domain-containing protein [Desulfovibrio piger]